MLNIALLGVIYYSPETMKATTIQWLKTLIWLYISLGLLIILVIGFICFVMPAFWPNREISAGTLDLMEKILLGWGLILLPFLKFAQIYAKKMSA